MVLGYVNLGNIWHFLSEFISIQHTMADRTVSADERLRQEPMEMCVLWGGLSCTFADCAGCSSSPDFFLP